MNGSIRGLLRVSSFQPITSTYHQHSALISTHQHQSVLSHISYSILALILTYNKLKKTYWVKSRFSHKRLYHTLSISCQRSSLRPFSLGLGLRGLRNGNDVKTRMLLQQFLHEKGFRTLAQNPSSVSQNQIFSQRDIITHLS